MKHVPPTPAGRIVSVTEADVDEVVSPVTMLRSIVTEPSASERASGGECVVCHATTTDGVFVCHPCIGDHLARLSEARDVGLVRLLDDNVARLNVGKRQAGAARGEHPDVIDAHAYDVRRDLRTVDWHPDARARREWRTTLVGAGSFVRDRRLIRAALAIVDGPPERVFVGVCQVNRSTSRPCGTQLYAPKGDPVVECPTCHATHLVAGLLDRTVRHWREEWVQLDAIKAGLSRWRSVTIPAATWRQWRKRRKLTVCCDVPTRAELYHVGALFDLAEQWTERQARAREGRDLPIPIEDGPGLHPEQ